MTSLTFQTLAVTVFKLNESRISIYLLNLFQENLSRKKAAS